MDGDYIVPLGADFRACLQLLPGGCVRAENGGQPEGGADLLQPLIGGLGPPPYFSQKNRLICDARGRLNF
jgi:hypothetical protein